jgi:hypothetical protein
LNEGSRSVGSTLRWNFKWTVASCNGIRSSLSYINIHQCNSTLNNHFSSFSVFKIVGTYRTLPSSSSLLISLRSYITLFPFRVFFFLILHLFIFFLVLLYSCRFLLIHFSLHSPHFWTCFSGKCLIFRLFSLSCSHTSSFSSSSTYCSFKRCTICNVSLSASRLFP